VKPPLDKDGKALLKTLERTFDLFGKLVNMYFDLEMRVRALEERMPLLPGKKNVGKNIKELHKGPRYAANLSKFGTKKANLIAVATAENVSRRKPKKKSKR
jgi:hypothetical protein